MKKSKLLTLLLTLIMAFTLPSCVITDGYTSSGSYTLDVNIQTVSGNQSNYNSLTEMLDAVRPSVFEVYTTNTVTGYTGAGSAVVFGKAVEGTNKHYYVLTCHHVIEGANQISLTATNGNKYTATLVGGDKQSDIAVLTMTTTNEIPVATIRLDKDSTHPLKVGEDVVAIGNPLGILGGSVTKGIVSAINRNIQVEDIGVMSLIQTDCSTNAGNSGGGLFDINGNLIGITNSGYAAYQGLNFAVPIDTAIEIANELMETFYFNSILDYNFGYVSGRYYAAAKYSPVLSFGDEIAIYYEVLGFNSYVDCVVEAVRPGSVYQKAGFSVYDRIVGVTVAGKSYSVTDSESLVNFLNKLKLSATNNTIVFTVVKNGASAPTDLTVTYEQYIYGNTYL